MGMPSCIASSFSHGDAFISSKPERTTTCTSSPPSLRAVLDDAFDAVFVGSGAPRGRDLDVPGRAEAAKHIHIGIDWLSSVSFEHVNKIGKRVIVLAAAIPRWIAAVPPGASAARR